MKRLELDPLWPESWKQSFSYDRMEVFGEIPPESLGYAYAYQARAENTLDLVRRSVPKGSRILDVAAAQGNFTLLLAEAGYEVTWNDLRPELAGYVRAKWERGVVHYLPGNVLDLSGFRNEFDAVVIAEVIEHVARPDRFLRKISTLVKPGGAIVMTTPNGEYFRNSLPRFSDCSDPSIFEANQFRPDADGHIFLLHQDEIYRLASETGLRVSEVRMFTNLLTQGHLKSRILLPVLPRKGVQAVEKITRRVPSFLRRKIHTHLAVLLRRQTSPGSSPVPRPLVSHQWAPSPQDPLRHP